MAEFRSVGDNVQKLRLKIPVQIRRLRTKKPVCGLIGQMNVSKRLQNLLRVLANYYEEK